MKTKRVLCVLFVLLFMLNCMPSFSFADGETVQYFEDFSSFETGELTDPAGIYSFTTNNIGAVAITDDKAVRITKSSNTATMTLNAEFSSVINTLTTDYAVSFKLKEAMTNAQSFNINMAACISFKKTSSNDPGCILQYYDSDAESWVTTDQYYNTSEGCTVKFVIKSK